MHPGLKDSGEAGRDVCGSLAADALDPENVDGQA